MIRTNELDICELSCAKRHGCIAFRLNKGDCAMFRNLVNPFWVNNKNFQTTSESVYPLSKLDSQLYFKKECSETIVPEASKIGYLKVVNPEPFFSAQSR